MKPDERQAPEAELTKAPDEELTAKLIETSSRLIAAVEEFGDRSWQAADALLAITTTNLGLFAIARAYYALYNMAVAAATILNYPLDRYQQGDHHHEENCSIPHSQLPVLVSDLYNVIYFEEVTKGDKGKTEQAFAITRELQKHRKRADYMGCETVSLDEARKCISWARTLFDTIMRYTKEQHDGNS